MLPQSQQQREGRQEIGGMKNNEKRNKRMKISKRKRKTGIKEKLLNETKKKPYKENCVHSQVSCNNEK